MRASHDASVSASARQRDKLALARGRHRDWNNEGPSILLISKQCEGGNLLYWPRDSGFGDVSDLSPSEAMVLNGTGPILFDGRKAHEVQAYPEGCPRGSAVFYTAANSFELSERDQNALSSMGLQTSTTSLLARTMGAVRGLKSKSLCVDSFQKHVDLEPIGSLARAR